uniref:Putative secreted protein n=1 Tax=Anopheles marajoara TaxID=58244 RepID=A0A2M4C7C2_9DIPT
MITSTLLLRARRTLARFLAKSLSLYPFHCLYLPSRCSDISLPLSLVKRILLTYTGSQMFPTITKPTLLTRCVFSNYISALMLSLLRRATASAATAFPLPNLNYLLSLVRSLYIEAVLPRSSLRNYPCVNGARHTTANLFRLTKMEGRTLKL